MAKVRKKIATKSTVKRKRKTTPAAKTARPTAGKTRTSRQSPKKEKLMTPEEFFAKLPKGFADRFK